MLLGKEEEEIKKNIALNISFFLITSTQNTPVPPSHSLIWDLLKNLFCRPSATCNWTVVLPEVR